MTCPLLNEEREKNRIDSVLHIKLMNSCRSPMDQSNNAIRFELLKFDTTGEQSRENRPRSEN